MSNAALFSPGTLLVCTAVVVIVLVTFDDVAEVVEVVNAPTF